MGRDKNTRQPRLRADRARLAKETINKIIPSLLLSYPIARAGAAGAQLLREADLPNATMPMSYQMPIIIRVTDSDTLDAARDLHSSHQHEKIGVLSMASPLRPGGGVLTGATSQEESLCMRSTLFPSLRDEFYRVPEDALIYTSHVLVFRDQDLTMLRKEDRFFVDVMSCAALRFPDVENGRYVSETDREAMVKKIQLIMRAAVMKGCKRVVLGALGCGAYGNPAEEVAALFKRVIVGNSKKTCEETWTGIKEVVFAIRGGQDNIKVFNKVFPTPIPELPP